jgi:hypothetical protein
MFPRFLKTGLPDVHLSQLLQPGSGLELISEPIRLDS